MIRWGLRVAVLSAAALAATSSAPVHAQANCVSPGDILDVPTPGFLRTDPPNLVFDFERGTPFLPVTALSVTTARIRIAVPNVGMIPNVPIKVRHIDAGGGTRVIANARSCNFSTGGGGVSAGGGPAASDAARTRPNLGATIRATRNDVVAPSGAPEFVIMGSPEAATRAAGIVTLTGGTVLRRQVLNSLGLGMVAVDLNGLITVEQLRGEFSRRGIDVSAGRHQVYRAAAGPRNYAAELLGISAGARCRLPSSVRIGIIDGPVDTRHPTLSGIAIETASVLSPLERRASTDHATGIAGLIAGREDGLAPGVTLFAVTAVSRAGTREVAKLENVAKALDWLTARKVRIVNMSLAGPPNVALGRALRAASANGAVLIAAAGNDAGQRVAYPAADPGVIAVTAVDASKRLYRKASRGAEIDFAAPGVDLRVAAGRSTAFRSGTSYASAVVTALAAFEASRGRVSTEDVRRALVRRSEDLGPAGRDTGYGYGLVKFGGC